MLSRRGFLFNIGKVAAAIVLAPIAAALVKADEVEALSDPLTVGDYLHPTIGPERLNFTTAAEWIPDLWNKDLLEYVQPYQALSPWRYNSEGYLNTPDGDTIHIISEEIDSLFADYANGQLSDQVSMENMERARRYIRNSSAPPAGVVIPAVYNGVFRDAYLHYGDFLHAANDKCTYYNYGNEDGAWNEYDDADD